jgi:opacity protein-like surface antigen
MKCLRLALAACAAAVSFHGIAHAADPYQPAPVVVEEAPYEDTLGFYLRGDIGWSFLEWSGGNDDNAFTGGGGVGYQFTQNLRGDVRVDWSGDYDIGPNADLSTTTLLGNMYFDIPTETIFTPYVGGGAGWGWASVDGGNSDDAFTYSLMAGATIDLSRNLDLDIGYRFIDMTVDGPDIYDHQIMTGVRLNF